MKRKKSPGSRANQRALRREKSAPGAIARLLPELLETQHQATEQAAAMIEESLAPGARARSSLGLVLNTLIECRSLLAAAEQDSPAAFSGRLAASENPESRQ